MLEFIAAKDVPLYFSMRWRSLTKKRGRKKSRSLSLCHYSDSGGFINDLLCIQKSKASLEKYKKLERKTLISEANFFSEFAIR